MHPQCSEHCKTQTRSPFVTCAEYSIRTPFLTSVHILLMSIRSAPAAVRSLKSVGVLAELVLRRDPLLLCLRSVTTTKWKLVKHAISGTLQTN